MENINVNVGFYPVNHSANPDLIDDNIALSYSYYNVADKVAFNMTSNPTIASGLLNGFTWGNSSNFGMLGQFIPPTLETPISGTILLALSQITTTKTITIEFTNYINVNVVDIPVPWEWTVNAPFPPNNYILEIVFNGTEPEYLPYIMFTVPPIIDGFAANGTIKTTGDGAHIQYISYVEGSIPLAPIKWTADILYLSPSTNIDITNLGVGTGGYATLSESENASLSGGQGGALGFESLPGGSLIQGTINADNQTQSINLFFSSLSSGDASILSFYTDGMFNSFPLPELNSQSGWIFNRSDSLGGRLNVYSISSSSPTLYPVLSMLMTLGLFQAKLDWGEVISIGIQGFQYSNSTAIPVCLSGDSTVWKIVNSKEECVLISSLKSGDYIKVVSKDGYMSIAKISVFKQINQNIHPCYEFEQDVITSINHIIFYPEHEDIYASERNFELCQPLEIKGYKPILASQSNMKQVSRDKLYHIILEDLDNWTHAIIVGFNKRLLSELYRSPEIKLRLDGFVKIY